MTRDSLLWQILFYGGLVVTALSYVPNPADYAIPLEVMPYIRLLALIASVVGGKLGLSFLNSSAQKVEKADLEAEAKHATTGL